MPGDHLLPGLTVGPSHFFLYLSLSHLNQSLSHSINNLVLKLLAALSASLAYVLLLSLHIAMHLTRNKCPL